MNAKIAKKLRRIAEGMVLTAEEKSGNKIEKVAYLQNKAGTIIVDKRSWKGAYKSLKKGLRKATKGDAFHKSLTTTATRHEAVVEAPVL